MASMKLWERNRTCVEVVPTLTAAMLPLAISVSVPKFGSRAKMEVTPLNTALPWSAETTTSLRVVPAATKPLPPAWK